jgi:peroxiredoxin
MAILFGSSDPSVYTKCLKDGTGLIKTPWIKRPVTNYLRSRGKGMSAFNFSLPADSSGRIVKLSDFKGKVILLDMWAYNCTGCYLFNNVFHKMVFPIFKNNPDFAVVSVMADESTKSSYMDRLRGKGGVTMTSSDYTNLFGGKGQVMGRAMEQHYVISGYPAIFLIDKSGKIYSSTLPYFNESDSPNVQKLIEVIKKALTES